MQKTKEELLKIYSAYLPYKLKIETESKSTYTMLTVYPQSPGKTIGLMTVEGLYSADYVKPILYSMEMLTQEIEHNGERFIPLVKLAKIQYPNVDFIIDNICIGRLNAGGLISFEIDDELPFYKEYHHNVFMQFTSEDYDDMHLGNMKPSELREKLIEWKLNIFGLSESEYIKKETLK